MVGHWTCDSEGVGSSLGRVQSCNYLGQDIHTLLPQSPMSTIWHWHQNWENNGRL